MTAQTFGFEIIPGDVLVVPVHGELRVLAVERDDYGARLHTEDGAVLVSRFGALVTVAAYADREWRLGRRSSMSHVHFPGSIADTWERRLIPSLTLAAVDAHGQLGHRCSVSTDQSDSGGGLSVASCTCGERSERASYAHCRRWAVEHEQRQRVES